MKRPWPLLKDTRRRQKGSSPVPLALEPSSSEETEAAHHITRLGQDQAAVHSDASKVTEDVQNGREAGFDEVTEEPQAMVEDNSSNAELIGPTFRSRLIYDSPVDSDITTGEQEPPYRNLCQTCHHVFATLVKPHGTWTNVRRESTDLSSMTGHVSSRHPGYSLLHHRNLAALEESARTECPLCHLFWAESFSVSRAYGLSSGGPVGVPAFELDLWFKASLKAMLAQGQLYAADVQGFVLRLERGQYAYSQIANVWFATAFVSLCEQPSSRLNEVPSTPPLSLANEWIATCRQNHRSCSRRHGVLLPTRLIDIGETSSVAPRLVLTDSLSFTHPKANYTALSHCWGERTPKSCLKKANLHSYLEKIVFDDEEQKFQDAIFVTRQLGYRYLWIDLFCIVQDDPADWQRECSRMEDVYSNAEVTIAATMATDAYTGFLKPRPQLRRPECEILLETENGPLGKLRILQSRDVKRPEPDSAKSDPAPLMSRAWAFQERLLSRRILHFGYRRMVWECKVSKITEGELHPFETSLMHEAGSPSLAWLDAAPGASDVPKTLDTEAHYTSCASFYDIVTTYSGCRLTYGDDILPALSGIAKRFHLRSGDEYLAGLWKSHLIIALSWEKHNDGTEGMARFEHPASLRVPSWSWAALGGKVRWPSDHASPKQALAECLAASVTKVGKDPFGQVNGGQIIVRGFVFDFAHGLSVDLKAILRRHHGSNDSNLQPHFLDTDGDANFSQIVFDHRSVETRSSEWKCLVLSYSVPDGLRQRRSEYKWYGLVLESIGGLSATFRRLGHIEGVVYDAHNADLTRSLESAKLTDVCIV